MSDIESKHANEPQASKQEHEAEHGDLSQEVSEKELRLVTGGAGKTRRTRESLSWSGHGDSCQFHSG